MKKVIHSAIDVKKTRKKKVPRKEKLLYTTAMLSGLVTLLAVTGAVVVVIVMFAFSSTLPSPTRLTNRSIEQSTKIYDRNDQLLYSVYDTKNRTLVTLDEVSPYLLQATLATEDADFYRHEGIDFVSVGRGAFNTLSGKGKQSGSTLTQQVAKNALLSSEQTIIRKVKDMVLALQIEKTYTKDEILQLYINEVPYGGTTWGIEAAAKTFFDKTAKDLTLAEAALLAGLPQSPTRYSPFSHPEIAKNRQKYVLWLMKERGWIDAEGTHHSLTEEEYETALAEPLEYARFRGTIRAPHFVMYVLEELRDRYGEELVTNGGLKIKTTLDIDLHEEYQQILSDIVEKEGVRYGFSNAGLVAITPKTGEIISMVGSADFFSEEIDGQYNVTTGLRQPGSALKPITYLTGLTQGYTASTVLYDVYTEFDTGENTPKYTPKNYGGWGFRGPIQLRYALANSVNVTAVKMLDLVGIPNMVRMANNLGVHSLSYDPARHGLALTLGGGEVRLLDLTHGFSSIGAGGEYHDLVSILEVKNYKGELIDKHVDHPGKQVVDERLVWILSNILSDNSARNAAFGSRSQLYIPNQKVAVKTGTTDDLRDNWTVGFTSDVAIGVWVGNNDNSEMNNRLASGLTGAAPIWHNTMVHFLQTTPHQEFPRPEGIEEKWVGDLSGMVPYEESEGRRVEYFVKGTEPISKSTMFKRVKICDDGDIEDKLYIEYRALKDEWQDDLERWIEEKYKDDEGELFRYMGPDYEKEKKPDRFDLDDCDEDDN